jgi:hypothetical protein
MPMVVPGRVLGRDGAVASTSTSDALGNSTANFYDPSTGMLTGSKDSVGTREYCLGLLVAPVGLCAAKRSCAERW